LYPETRKDDVGMNKPLFTAVLYLLPFHTALTAAELIPLKTWVGGYMGDPAEKNMLL
jgi:hypothetical protein